MKGSQQKTDSFTDEEIKHISAFSKRPHLKTGKKQRPALVLLSYKQSPVIDLMALDRAFDILFEEVLKSREKVINSSTGHLRTIRNIL